MPIDSSIYQNVRPVPINIPSPLDAATGAMTLGRLGMQTQQMQLQMQQQQALRQAYSQNTNPDGSMNEPGVITTLNKNGMGYMTPELNKTFAEQQKAQADARSAQVAAAHGHLSLVVPAYKYLLDMPDDQAEKVYPNVLKQLSDQGVPVNNAEPVFNRGKIQQEFAIGSQLKEQLDNQATQATTNKANLEAGKIPSEIAKNWSEVGMAPIKRNAELYGSRSPNAELTSQYDKQAMPIRGSQVAMNQMIDNYKNPSPQGDKSLILNAFKIKFPTAPDVNSLEELTKSQAATDEWKNIVHKYTSGGLDQATRDNLMRDGVSTFRANVDTLRGYQEKTKARAKFQNVDDPTITIEPAVDKTYGEAMDLQKKIGPYVPPTERGGFMGAISGAASKLMNKAPEATATAAEKPAAQYRPSGAKVSGDEVAQYATRHKMKLSDAQNYLRSQGYAVDR